MLYYWLIIEGVWYQVFAVWLLAGWLLKLVPEYKDTHIDSLHKNLPWILFNQWVTCSAIIYSSGGDTEAIKQPKLQNTDQYKKYLGVLSTSVIITLISRSIDCSSRAFTPTVFSANCCFSWSKMNFEPQLLSQLRLEDIKVFRKM